MCSLTKSGGASDCGQLCEDLEEVREMVGDVRGNQWQCCTQPPVEHTLAPPHSHSSMCVGRVWGDVREQCEG